MSRVRHILVYEDSRGRVTNRRDRPHLLVVAAELDNEIRWIFGGGRCCQEFAWNMQWFSLHDIGHGRLQVLVKGRTHAEEDEGRASVQRSFARHIIAALNFRCICFPKHVGGLMESRRAGQMDAAHVGRGVGNLRFELPALVGGENLRASVTIYPSGL